MTEVAHEFNLTEDALRIERVSKRVDYLLDGHAPSRFLVFRGPAPETMASTHKHTLLDTQSIRYAHNDAESALANRFNHAVALVDYEADTVRLNHLTFTVGHRGSCTNYVSLMWFWCGEWQLMGE